jgi:hypothetical protein
MEETMRNRMMSGAGRMSVVIGLLLALAGCVVAPAYGPGGYYHHGYYHYHYYDR